MLISTALVLLMTPALAFFYGGLVRSKNALNTMMMSFISLGFVGVLWAVAGYSLALTAGNNWIGDPSRLFLRGRGARAAGDDPARPVHVLSGHVLHHHGRAHLGRDRRADALFGLPDVHQPVGARRLRPIAHWVWGGGWLADMGALDFAGGTVVHVNAGVAALVAAFVVGKRRDFKVAAPAAQRAVHAARRRTAVVRLVRIQRRQRARGRRAVALAFTTTMLAPAGTLVVWTMLDIMRTGKPTAVGAATGIVVGLVAVTPAAGFIGPMSAIVLGFIAAVPSYFGLVMRAKTQLDDSLDVVAAHGVGGTVGALLTGVFAQKA